MRSAIMSYFENITPEEKEILKTGTIQKERYSEGRAFVVDSHKLMAKGQLIELHAHTRFAPFPKHRHNFVEIVYMYSGRTTHIINGKEKIELSEGDLLLMNQNVYHEFLPAGKEDIAVDFTVLPEFFHKPMAMLDRKNALLSFLADTFSSGDSGANYLHIPAKGILPVENLLETLIWSLIDNKRDMESLLQTTMGLTFMYLSVYSDKIVYSGGAQEEQNLVLGVIRYIESHFVDGTLEEISEKLERPAYYLSRLLKKHTSFNFKELLQQRKLQQAAYLLTQTSLSAESIMNAIGYDNSSYFYRKFRERYGCSPKEYRVRAKIG